MSKDRIEEDFAMQDRFDIATAAAWCRRYPAQRHRIAEMAAVMAEEHAEKRGAPVRIIAAIRYARAVLRAAGQRSA